MNNDNQKTSPSSFSFGSKAAPTLPDADYGALENYWVTVKIKEKAGL